MGGYWMGTEPFSEERAMGKLPRWPNNRLVTARQTSFVFLVGKFGRQNSSKEPEGKVARLRKNRGHGTGKGGRMSKTVPFFSDISPISYQFDPFFIHFPKCNFDNFSQFPVFLHFPPFPPHFPPFSHIFHFPHFPKPLRWAAIEALAAGRRIRRRLTRKPATNLNRI